MKKIYFVLPIIVFAVIVILAFVVLNSKQGFITIDKTLNDVLKFNNEEANIEIIGNTSTSTEYEVNGLKYLEIHEPRYYDGSIWKPIDLTLVNVGTNNYDIDESDYKVKVRNNEINLSRMGIKIKIQVPSTTILEVANNYIIYDISNADYNATIKYTFNLAKVSKLITIYQNYTTINNFSYSEHITSGSGKTFTTNSNSEGDFVIQTTGYYYNENLNYPLNFTFTNNNITIALTSAEILQMNFPFYIDPDLDVNGITTSLGGNVVYDVVLIRNNGTLQINSTGWLNLTANSNFTLEAGSSIDGYAKGSWIGGNGGARGNPGYSSGATAGTAGSPGTAFDGAGSLGGGGGGASNCAGGGSAGSSGARGTQVGTQTLRFEVGTNYSGEGAGGGGGGGGACDTGGLPPNTGTAGGTGGTSGASIKIYSPLIEIHGNINVSAGNGGSGGTGGSGPGFVCSYGGGGGGGGAGGSGGQVIIDGTIVNISDAKIYATGGNAGTAGTRGTGNCGNGANGNAGQNGYGGRMKIFYGLIYNTSITQNVLGGNSDPNINGTIYYLQTNFAPNVTSHALVPFNASVNTTNVYLNTTIIDIEGDGVASVYYTITKPNGTILVNNINGTNIGGSEWHSPFFNISADDSSLGYWNWSATPYDGLGLFQTSNYQFLITDPDAPVITIYTPGNNDLYENGSLSVNLITIPTNFTIFDLVNVSSCYYTIDNGIINTTITNCANNHTVPINVVNGSYNLMFTATDSSGLNTTSTISNINTRYINTYAQFVTNTTITEGGLTTFNLNVTRQSIPATSAVLIWNNTIYSPTTQSLAGNTFSFTRQLTIPANTGNVTGLLKPWYWQINVNGVINNWNTTEQNQTVYSVAIDNCSIYSAMIANFTLYDENTNIIMSNTTSSTIEVDLILTSKTDSSVQWIYHTTTPNKNLQICIPNGILNTTNFQIDTVASYEATGYVKEFWYLENGTLDNTNYYNSYTSHNIEFRNLPIVDSTTFLFTFTNDLSQQEKDIIAHVYRYYIGDGIFREVERAKTDNNGETHVHLIEEDVIYYFQITKDGITQYTSTQYNAKCLSTPCSISLSANALSNPFPNEWDNLQQGTYSIKLDRPSREVELLFNLNQTGIVNLTVWRYSNVLNSPDIVVCSNMIISQSGSLQCVVPLLAGNTSYYATFEYNNNLVTSKWVDLTNTGFEIYGTTGIFISVLIVLSVGLIAISSGPWVVLFTLMALFFVGILKILDMDWYSLITLISAGLILIYKILIRRT